MCYPEEEIAFCRGCGLDIPADNFWRGKGTVSGGGVSLRTVVLYNACPDCGRRHSYGLGGHPVYRVLYSWMWKLRYPANRPPANLPPMPQAVPQAVPMPRRRAVGE